MLDEKSCGYKVKYYRTSAGYNTQKSIAKVLGMSTATYLRYETQPFSMPIKNFVKLAEVFGCELADFFKA